MTTFNPYQPPSPTTTGPATPYAADLAPYVASAALARASVIGLTIALITDVAATASGLFQFSVLGAIASGTHSSEQVELNDRVYGACGVLPMLAIIGTAIVFCMWFHRVYRNVRAFGLATTYTPGWAPGSFFVPFINLVRPYQIAKEIFIKCEDGRDGAPGAAGPVSLWWTLFLGSNIVANVGTRIMLQAKDPDSMQVATVVTLLSDLLSIGAAVAAIKMIGEIERRQVAKHAEMQATATAAAATSAA